MGFGTNSATSYSSQILGAMGGGANAAGAVGSLASNFSIAGQALSLVTGLYQFGKGIVEEYKGKQEARRTVRPTLDISKPYDNMLGLFENLAQYGLDANALTFSNNQNQNALTASLNTILQSGGDPNAVNQAFQSYAKSTQDLAIEDSTRRWQKVAALSDATDKLSQAKIQEFLYNEDAPFKDKAQLNAAQIQSGGQNQMAGLDAITANLLRLSNANYKPSSTYAPQTQPVVINNSTQVTPEGYPQISPNAITRGPGLQVDTSGSPYQVSYPSISPNAVSRGAGLTVDTRGTAPTQLSLLNTLLNNVGIVY